MLKFLELIFGIGNTDELRHDEKGNKIISSVDFRTGESYDVPIKQEDYSKCPDAKDFIKNLEEEEPQEIILKEGSFDVSKIKEYKPEVEIKKFIFRPQTFDQFIGQGLNKERILMNIEKIKMGIKTHFFFDAIQGHGKTTMAYLIAKELNAHMIERVGQQVCDEDLVNIINEMNSCKEEYIVLFIDEIDTLNPKICKTFNTMLEDFKVAGKNIKPFIFIGATINKFLVKLRSPDTLDRISTQIRFHRYSKKEIEKIIKQVYNQLFKQYDVPQNAFEVISANCKYSPRISTTMLEDFIVAKDVNKVLEYYEVVKDGLTKTDFKVLQALADNNGKPLGGKALAQRIGINEKDYTEIYEPFLCEFGYMVRGQRGRLLSAKGKEILS